MSARPNQPNRRSCALLAWVVALALDATAVHAQWPAGSPFLVNTYTLSAAWGADVAADPVGGFVVVWENGPVPEDASGSSIRARRFASDGTPLTAEVQVNSYTTSNQSRPAVAIESDGDFVVTWTSLASSGPDVIAPSIQGRRFSSNGVPLAAEFQVNVQTTILESAPTVAVADDGRFVVSWLVDLTLIGGAASARRWASDGTGEPAELDVSQSPSPIVHAPEVAADPDGDFVVVWQYGYYSYSVIRGRRFTSSGAALPPFQVSEETSNGDRDPSVALADDGDFVVTWSASVLGGSADGIEARLYSSAGAPLSGELLVTADRAGVPWSSSAGIDGDGNFTVAWLSDYHQGVARLRSFTSTGEAVSRELEVVGAATRAPSLAMMQPGAFVVAWTDAPGGYGPGTRVRAQLYSDLIFADDFESGDLSRWTLPVGAAYLAVTPGAALVGSLGMAVDIGNSGPTPDMRYVRDDTPDAVDRYRARVYLDPNGYTPGSPGERIKLFQLLSEVPDQRRLVTIVLRATGGGYELRAKVRADDGTVHNTGGFPLTDAAHYIEIAWQQSTAPGLEDGYLKLSLDGVEVASLAGVDNDQRAAERARLGALGVKPGTNGTIYLDAFESRRLAPIGAAP